MVFQSDDSLNDYQIILASGSSRRKDFLESLSIPFTIKTNQVDETFPPELKGKKIAEFIVRQKYPFVNSLRPKQIVITADTIVCVVDIWENRKTIK